MEGDLTVFHRVKKPYYTYNVINQENHGPTEVSTYSQPGEAKMKKIIKTKIINENQLKY